VVVYVDDFNIIGMVDIIFKIVSQLKGEFEMKDLGENSLCLGLHIEHLARNKFLHQSLYTRKLFKCFSINAAHLLRSPMVVQLLDPKNDEFRSCNEGEKCLKLETPYLAAIGALIHLANCTRPNIAFVVNSLARFNVKPTK
jgi:hypothetical protein